MIRAAIVGVLATAVLCACSDKSAEAGSSSAAAEKPTAETTAAQSLYQTDIAPIFAESCATCHLTGQEAGNMTLVPAKAIANLVAIPVKEAPNQIRVVPGDPDKSYLVMKLEGTHLDHGGSGVRMPLGAPPLAADKIAKIRQWIAEGAKP